MWSYRKRVMRDLKDWQAKGWIGEDAAVAIADDIAARGSRFSTGGVLAMLGAVLIGFSAMSFVAANWQEMPRLARLGLLFSGLWASYGTAGILASRNMGAFANAATLVGVGIFGASIMLIAQMFHIEGHPPDAVLMWAAGAVLAGVALSSTAALGAAMPLTMLWWGWAQSLHPGVFWWFLAGWAVITAAYLYHRWRPGFHLSAIALGVFVISLGFQPWIGGSHVTVVALGLCAAAAGLFIRHVWPDAWEDDAIIVIAYAMVVTFAGLFALQFIESVGLQALVVLAALTLALLLAAIYWGLKHDYRVIVWLGYVGFSIEVLGLYFKTFETLLGSSLFFLIAGVIVMALAGVAYKLHARSEHLEAH